MSNRSLVGWFKKHGQMAQVLASIVTALVALAALIGVKVQIDAAARSQQEQSAREIYREFLNLSIGNPQFAEPDYCAFKGTAQEAAYRNYVDYLLYTSEQMLAVSPEWEGALTQHVEAHWQYLCGVSDWEDYPASVRKLVARVKQHECSGAAIRCGP